MIARAAAPALAPLDERPVLRFARRETGEIEVLTPWYPRVEIAEELLAQAGAGERMGFTYRGGIVEFRCTNGGARYAMGGVEGGARVGVLVGSWGGARC